MSSVEWSHGVFTCLLLAILQLRTTGTPATAQKLGSRHILGIREAAVHEVDVGRCDSQAKVIYQGYRKVNFRSEISAVLR